MIVTLRDRSELHISDERGEKLKSALINGTAPEYIAIDGTIVRKDFIVKLKTGGNELSGKNYQLPASTTNDTVSEEGLAKLRKAREKYGL